MRAPVLIGNSAYRSAGTSLTSGNARSAFAVMRSGQHRREVLWAWLSVLVLLLCWDAATRLDQKVSPPRPRLTHMGESTALFPIALGISHLLGQMTRQLRTH